MPLSEHEQQLLDQIERALYAEDPKFASHVRGKRLKHPSRRRRLQGVVLAAVGLALLLGGLLVPWHVLSVPIVSVIGFPVMFAGVLMTLTSLRGADDDHQVDSESADSDARSSFSQRMEDRLRKRFDQQ